MIYRTCFGCIHQGKPCTERDAVRERLRGLGVTSVKWVCNSRIVGFGAGDPVWVDTVSGYSHVSQDGDERPPRDRFAGVVISVGATKAAVYIRPGTPGEDTECEFEPQSNGFCSIPFKRLTVRAGEIETICKYCGWPSSAGHDPNYGGHSPSPCSPCSPGSMTSALCEKSE
jgi:hypothetical protein